MTHKTLSIRNSTIDFLVFTPHTTDDGVKVVYKDEDIWLSQKLMAKLFHSSSDNIGLHIKNIYSDGELLEESTTDFFSVVQKEGNREVSRTIKFYNLDIIIAVGYRVNSVKATQFRQWATSVLKNFTIRGYIIDKHRMENGTVFGTDYFDSLLDEIRDIRLSERRFYQKVTDIFATSADYNQDTPTAQTFFATVQNKFHYAIHGKTASEVIVDRANSQKPHMGLTTWKNAPDGKVIKSDVSIAKNYLTADELDDLGSIVSAYLDLAENRAKRKIPMTMNDWAKHLDKILVADDRELLQNAGTISQEIAKQHVETEYEHFRPLQDKVFQSDFDKMVKHTVQSVSDTKENT